MKHVGGTPKEKEYRSSYRQEIAKNNDAMIYEPLTDEKKKYLLRPREKGKEIHASLVTSHPVDMFEHVKNTKISISLFRKQK